jgi:beta-phosphoglucomutase-like phosphatase (HAD superfamily)
VSEPEAKQYLLDSIEQCREALSLIASASDLDAQKKTIENVVQLLEGLKEKVFFKTKKAMSPAFLLLEASKAMADQADAATGSDEDALEEFREAVDKLKESASALESASKTQSVIVT